MPWNEYKRLRGGDDAALIAAGNLPSKPQDQS
jgi:hypothetical protein